jgi:hypothetical protein
MAGFFDGMFPPEVEAKMRQAREQDRMVRESLKLEIDNFFLDLSADNLATFKLILSTVADDTSGRLAAYYEGIASQTLVLKHNRCGGCGGPAHESADDLLKSHKEEKDEGDEPDPFSLTHPSGTESFFDKPDGADVLHPEAEHIGHTGLLHPDTIKKMEELNLDDLREEETNRILGFVCKGCGLKYVSIHDRSLREDCDGCIQKTKWG